MQAIITCRLMTQLLGQLLGSYSSILALYFLFPLLGMNFFILDVDNVKSERAMMS